MEKAGPRTTLAEHQPSRDDGLIAQETIPRLAFRPRSHAFVQRCWTRGGGSLRWGESGVRCWHGGAEGTEDVRPGGTRSTRLLRPSGLWPGAVGPGSDLAQRFPAFGLVSDPRSKPSGNIRRLGGTCLARGGSLGAAGPCERPSPGSDVGCFPEAAGSSPRRRRGTRAAVEASKSVIGWVRRWRAPSRACSFWFLPFCSLFRAIRRTPRKCLASAPPRPRPVTPCRAVSWATIFTGRPRPRRERTDDDCVLCHPPLSPTVPTTQDVRQSFDAAAGCRHRADRRHGRL